MEGGGARGHSGWTVNDELLFLPYYTDFMMFDTLPRDGDRLVLPRKLELGKYFGLEPLDMQTCPVGG